MAITTVLPLRDAPLSFAFVFTYRMEVLQQNQHLRYTNHRTIYLPIHQTKRFENLLNRRLNRNPSEDAVLRRLRRWGSSIPLYRYLTLALRFYMYLVPFLFLIKKN